MYVRTTYLVYERRGCHYSNIVTHGGGGAVVVFGQNWTAIKPVFI